MAAAVAAAVATNTTTSMRTWKGSDEDDKGRKANYGRRRRSTTTMAVTNVGALMIRIGFWGPVYYNYNKEPPKYYRQLLRPLYYLIPGYFGPEPLRSN